MQLIDTMMLEMAHKVMRKDLKLEDIVYPLRKEITKILEGKKKSMISIASIHEFLYHIMRAKGVKPPADIEEYILELVKHINLEIIEELTIFEASLAASFRIYFKQLSTVDSWLASIAIKRKYELVTTDSDFISLKEFFRHNTLFGNKMRIRYFEIGDKHV